MLSEGPQESLLKTALIPCRYRDVEVQGVWKWNRQCGKDLVEREQPQKYHSEEE